jgi:zinc/manganese transport system ATP-binding protein
MTGMTGVTGDQPAVSFHDAAATVGGRVIWSGVEMSIGQGEFVAILGPNGSGKSTLIKAALGLLPLASGSARVMGAPPGEASGQIGYLPQRRSFDAGLRMRGIDIVRLGLDGNRWGFPLWQQRRHHREASARVDELIDLVGAQAYAHRPIGELSGGEQQRLLIAQALAHRPSLLLLDEPLDSLDLTTQASVAALISDICRRQNVTVMIVAHDVNPILSHLNGVIYVAQGSVVQGSPRDVITSETLTRLYGTPIEVLKTSSGALVVVGQPDTGVAHHHHGDEAHR